MAAICGGLLALLDAGVPVLAAVAGISVGLLAVDKDTPPSDIGLVLDLTGTEDHYGAMDFKIGGTRDAVTALQLDVKEPIALDVLVSALKLGGAGRNAVLDEMESQIGLTPRSKPKLTARMYQNFPRFSARFPDTNTFSCFPLNNSCGRSGKVRRIS